MITNFTPIVRNYRGSTISVLPITEAACGAIRNGPATCLLRIVGGQYAFDGCEAYATPLHALKNARRRIQNHLRLRAIAKAQLAATSINTTLPRPPAIVSQTVHFETRKAFNANDPLEQWKVTSTLRTDGKIRVSDELVR